MNRIRLVTLDLDDTLWPVASCIARAEIALHRWFEQNAPATAAHLDVEALRGLRREIELLRPDLAGDLSALRRESVALALERSGDDPALAAEAFDVFWQVRNQADCFDDVRPALATLKKNFVVGAVTNGNACIKLAGLGEYFDFSLSAQVVGAAKPARSIFLEACRRAGVPTQESLHAGDDIDCDVRGALNAGLHAAWINRDKRQLRLLAPPAKTFPDLAALADHLCG